MNHKEVRKVRRPRPTPQSTLKPLIYVEEPSIQDNEPIIVEGYDDVATIIEEPETILSKAVASWFVRKDSRFYSVDQPNSAISAADHLRQAFLRKWQRPTGWARCALGTSFPDL